jgi:hypothetical protein
MCYKQDSKRNSRGSHLKNTNMDTNNETGTKVTARKENSFHIIAARPITDLLITANPPSPGKRAKTSAKNQLHAPIIIVYVNASL